MESFLIIQQLVDIAQVIFKSADHLENHDDHDDQIENPRQPFAEGFLGVFPVSAGLHDQLSQGLVQLPRVFSGNQKHFPVGRKFGPFTIKPAQIFAIV